MIGLSVTEKVFVTRDNFNLSINFISFFGNSADSGYLVQDGEGGLGVPVGGVGHPATRLENNDLKHPWLHESNGKNHTQRNYPRGSYDVYV